SSYADRIQWFSKFLVASRANSINEDSSGLSLPVFHAVPSPTVTSSSSGRTAIDEFSGKDWEPGTKLTPNPALTSAMSVEVSVASWTMRGRNPARRAISEITENTEELRGYPTMSSLAKALMLTGPVS